MDLYTLEQLNSLSGVTDIHRLSLKLLLDYYEHNLMPYVYEFEIPNNPSIILTFPKAQFCHLLAIEKIMTLHNQNNKNVKQYKGIRGYQNIQNQKITLDIFRKKPHMSIFSKNENKFIYFHLLHKLIEKPKLINYDQTKVTPSTRIDADFVFYDVMSDNYIHLGVVRTGISGNNYVPRSWFIEPKGEPFIDKFVKRQDQIIFTKISKYGATV